MCSCCGAPPWVRTTIHSRRAQHHEGNLTVQSLGLCHSATSSAPYPVGSSLTREAAPQPTLRQVDDPPARFLRELHKAGRAQDGGPARVGPMVKAHASSVWAADASLQQSFRNRMIKLENRRLPLYQNRTKENDHGSLRLLQS
jgi:hypothetical protein